MLKLISGTLVGSANYNEIHLDPDDEDASTHAQRMTLTHVKKKKIPKMYQHYQK